MPGAITSHMLNLMINHPIKKENIPKAKSLRGSFTAFQARLQCTFKALKPKQPDVPLRAST
jgi:hypothetical protein